ESPPGWNVWVPRLALRVVPFRWLADRMLRPRRAGAVSRDDRRSRTHGPDHARAAEATQDPIAGDRRRDDSIRGPRRIPSALGGIRPRVRVYGCVGRRDRTRSTAGTRTAVSRQSRGRIHGECRAVERVADSLHAAGAGDWKMVGRRVQSPLLP